MKNLMIFGLFILCLVMAQFSFAQTADEIVEKYIEALGGKEKMLTLNTVKMSGNLSVQNADVELVVTSKHMVGIRRDIAVMGTENYQIVTPEKSWSYMPIQNQSSPEEASAEQHKSNLNGLDLQGILINYKEKGHTVDYKGKETVDGIECYNLAIVLKNGKAISYFIDAKTNRLFKNISKTLRNGEEVETSTTFSNYKQTKDGYWFAFNQLTSQGEISYSSIETNVPVDEGIFKVN